MPEKQTVRVEPPARYLTGCTAPAPERGTVDYLVEDYPLLLQATIARCNAKAACARNWVAQGDSEECTLDSEGEQE